MKCNDGGLDRISGKVAACRRFYFVGLLFSGLLSKKHPISTVIDIILVGGVYFFLIGKLYGEVNFSNAWIVGVWGLCIAGIVLSTFHFRKKLKSASQNLDLE